MRVRNDGVDDLESLWLSRFGCPPPLRTSSELTPAVLRTFARAPSARLSLEAALLEREAERARGELRAARETSQRLMAEARALLRRPIDASDLD